MPSEFIVYQNPLTVKKPLLGRKLKTIKQEKWIWMRTMKTLHNLKKKNFFTSFYNNRKVRNLNFVSHYTKVGGWGDKSKNSWTSWSEHKTIFN